MTDSERIAALEERVAVLERIAHTIEICNTNDPSLCDKYGKYVKKSDAAIILGVTRATVYAMLADGRLRATHGGSRVATKSIEEYIQTPHGKSGRIGIYQEGKMKHGTDTLEET